MATRKSYDGAVVCAPVTVPYVRYSHESAHWWAGRALQGLARKTGLGPAGFDGVCFASFSAVPDSGRGTRRRGCAPAPSAPSGA